MISWNDLYTVLTAVIPLYVAMILAYGSVRWWKILSPDQCSGINRFVAIFAVPLLSFHFISTNNPYAMNFRFIAADTLQKIITLFGIGLWTNFAGKGSLDWMITLFSLSTLPNTLVMGIPLLIAMYGEHSGSLMVQIVVLQCIIWYTLLLFLLEYRGAKTLILEEFPETAASIVSFKVDAEVVSLDVRNFIDADAEIGDDGKLHVTVRKSNASKRSTGLGSIPVQTPRSSNLTGAEIFSLSSSSNTTPRGSNFNSTDCCSLLEVQGFSSGRQLCNSSPVELYSIQSSRGPTPRQSNFEENSGHRQTVISPCFGFYPVPNPDLCSNFPKTQKLLCEQCQLPYQQHSKASHDDAKELHMFVWSSSSTSPVSDDDRLHVYGGTSFDATGEKSGRSEHCVKEIRMLVADHHHPLNGETKVVPESDDFPVENLDFERKEKKEKEASSNGLRMLGSTSRAETYRKATGKKMPPASVMIRLILIMVWRKLIRNLNTYSSLIGLTWSLIAFRWHMSMPKIIEKSISILSDAGLGMAMFSLGLFMGLQPKIIACGNTVAVLAMAVRFLAGPAVMAAASVAVGLRGALLHIAIVQAALPQGIVPFVFAKEYNVHPEILSTAVIFGMLIALPITLVYYVVLGL